MSSHSSFPAFRVMALITTPRLTDRATELLLSEHIPLHFRVSARGTAPSEMMDLLGLGDTTKTVLLALLPKPCTAQILKRLKKELKIGTVDSGIGFTIPVSGGTKLLLSLLSNISSDTHPQKEEPPMNENGYSLIAAMVDQGFSEQVMNAARSAGAGGGTVLHSRQIADEAQLSANGMSIQEGKEIVLIVARSDQKSAIMQAIGTACGMHSDAKGHVISMPIDNVIGLSDD